MTRRGQHRLQVLESRTAHVGIVGGEGPSGNPHRLPLEREREQVEDVLAHEVRLCVPCELSLDEVRTASGNDVMELRVFVGQRDQRAAAAETQLEPEGPQAVEEAVSRDGDGHDLSASGSLRLHHIREWRDRAARRPFRPPPGAEAGERRDHRRTSSSRASSWHERADQERIAWRIAQRRANPGGVSANGARAIAATTGSAA